MTDRLPPIVISARDDASDDFKRVGRAAQDMGRDIDRGAKTASRGLDDLRREATAVGAALGTLVTAGALLGRNARDQEREIDGLRRAYGDAADEIIAFTESIQDSTNFSNDAAREAALVASTLTREYGLTADQAEQLVARSADLAQIHGIDLAGAVSRTASAIRGEAEAAEYLGIAMADSVLQTEAANRGMTGWTTTMTEAERAQIRFQVLMEQTAFATGAAGEAAQGAAGRGADLIHWLDDTAESLGGALGPSGQFLSVMGDIALAAPFVGAGLGRIAPAAALAARGLGALAIAAGPLGLVAAGAAGAFALHQLLQAEEKQQITAEAAAESTHRLAEAVFALTEAGATPDAIAAVQELDRATRDLIEMSVPLTEEFGTAWDQTEERLVRTAVALGQQTTPAIDAVTDSWDRYGLSADNITDINEDLAVIFSHTGDNLSYLLRLVEEANRDYQMGRIDAEGYAARIDDIAGAADRLGVSLVGANAADEETARSLADVNTAINNASRLITNATRDADRLGTATLGYTSTIDGAVQAEDAWRQSLDERARAMAGAEETTIRAGTATAGYTSTNTDAADQLARTTAGMEALAQRSGGMADALSEATRAGREHRAVLDDIDQGYILAAESGAAYEFLQGQLTDELGEYRTALGQTEEAERILRERQAAGLALSEEQIAFLNTIDATQARATGTAEDLAIQQGILAQAWLDSAEAQQALADEMGPLSDALGDLTDTLREIHGLPPLDDALGVSGPTLQSLQQAQVLLSGIFDVGARVAGDASGGPTAGLNRRHPTPPPANQPPPSQDLLAGGFRGGGGNIAGDIAPVVVPILGDDSGISATIRVVENDLADLIRRDYTAMLEADAAALENEATDAQRLMRAVSDGFYQSTLRANAAPAHQGISSVSSALANLDGDSASVTAYANTQPARNAINALTGYQGDAYVVVRSVAGPGGELTPFAHGGLVADSALPARNGRMIRWNEGGAGEMIWQPDGSLVISAPATKAALGQGRIGGGDVHIHAPVTIVARTGRVHDQFAAWARGSGR